MSRDDAHSLSRTAQELSVDRRSVGGTPSSPTWGAWQTIWHASVESVTLRASPGYNEAAIWLPDERWQSASAIKRGDMIRIRSVRPSESDRACIFCGFVVSRSMDFDGGAGAQGSHERLFFRARDFRWRIATSSPVFGQYARSESDYNNYGGSSQSPKDTFTFFAGRRCIFNPNRTKNRDAAIAADDIYVFHDATRSSSSLRSWWTARQMVEHLIACYAIEAYRHSTLTGITHADWTTVLHGISCEGLDVMTAVEYIASQLGWGVREDYAYNGTPRLAFFKVGSGTGIYARGDVPVISHDLHVPAVGESVSDTVHNDGPHLVCGGRIDEDISGVVNMPIAIGAPDEFEVTVPLVPGWLDSQLAYVKAAPFWPESECLTNASAQSSSFYTYFHTRGADFPTRRNVGRKWVLNEAGDYSAASTYNRGRPFDWTSVIPEAYQQIGDSLAWGPFYRRLLDCLTLDDEELASVGIRVEFSFDGGTTWKSITCAVRTLSGEAGIYIEEPNLSAILYDTSAKVGGSDAAWKETELNYWTSLCDDKENSKTWGNSPTWRTRVRVTATVRMDTRIGYNLSPGVRNGSPLDHRKLYDLSASYGLSKRTSSSVNTSSHKWEQDSITDGTLLARATAIRTANEDMSLAGRFVLDRLWFDDGMPHFMPGDVISRLTGRDYQLSTDLAGDIRPEIVEIDYSVRAQRMTLLTRDFRFSEVRL